ARMTVWSVGDITRDREKHENAFQHLQYAIDYLDHAPAGFFSVDGKGAIGYLNATLAECLDYDLATVAMGGLDLNDIFPRTRGGGASAWEQWRAWRRQDRGARPRHENARRQAAGGAAFSQGRLWRRWRAGPLAHARAAGAGR